MGTPEQIYNEPENAFVATFIGDSNILSGKMIDLVIEGINFSKMVYIISDKHQEISKMINKELQRGATLIYGKGSYTENNKIIIMCAVKRSNIIKIKSIIKNIDDKAFIIITDAVEVYGLGFR